MHVFSSNRVLHSGAHKFPAPQHCRLIPCTKELCITRMFAVGQGARIGYADACSRRPTPQKCGIRGRLGPKTTQSRKYSQCDCFVAPRYSCHIVYIYLGVQESTIQLGCLPWAKVRAWGVRMPVVAHQRHGSVARTRRFELGTSAASFDRMSSQREEIPNGAIHTGLDKNGCPVVKLN